MSNLADLWAPRPEASYTAIRIQLATLGIAGVAAIFGAFCVVQAAFPGPCGDNPGPALGVAMSWLVDAPLGFLALAVGLFIAKGLPVLRASCLFTAIAILSLPVMASLFSQQWHCS